MAHLSLSLLSPFQATLNGQPITDFKSNKVRALLAYLAVEADRPHARETLAGLLWPDYANRTALDNLRYTLSDLRGTIDDRHATPPFLCITRDTLQFNPDSDYDLDVKTFQQHIANRSDPIDYLRAAIELYRSSFLEGFSIGDSAPFEEWALLKKEQLERQMLAALRTVAADYEQRGEFQNAEPYARRQLGLAPWDEETHQQLMRILASSGQRSAALAQYDVCRRALKYELNVEPSRVTTKLYEDIRDGQFEIESARSPLPSPIEAARLGNVPIPLTSFVGRQREVSEVAQLLAPSPNTTGTRLITLIGAGGCGKTRLAIQVAHDLATARRFKHGVWWVDLSRLSDPALVPQAVAAVFGLRESSAAPLITLITNYLRTKQTLLIFDNCEHLIDACARLIDMLLSACPKLRIVATSREAIDLTGESVYRVPSLELPAAGYEASPEQLMQSDASRLFVERAMTVAANWQFEAHASTIARICARLDGIPLAIELAAVRLKLLSTEQIAARLDDRFHLLTGGSRTALPRHQTLRATMDWSYSLLTDEERVLFRRLSVFAGSWTFEAAEAIVGQDGISPDKVLDGLTRLVDKSLVVVMPQANEVRYRMLETIHEYAREKLIDAGEIETVRAHHLDFYVQFVERAEPLLRGVDQKHWLDRMEAEYDNLRAALEWSLGRDRTPGIKVEMGMRLAVALGEFWDRRNYWREGHAWLERALAAQSRDIRSRARAGRYVCRLERFLGDLAAARLHLEESLRLFQTLDDTHGIAASLFERASLAERTSDFVAAQADAEESLRLFESIGDKAGMADALHRLGHVTLDRGDTFPARIHFSESLRLFQAVEDKSWIGILLDDLAQVAHREGDHSTALALCEEALALEKELGYKFSMVGTLWLLGELAHVDDDYRRARTLYEQSLALARELDSISLIAGVLPNLGYAVLRHTDPRRAQTMFEEGLEYAREQDDQDSIAECLAGLAGVAAAFGRLKCSARLFGAIEVQLARTGYFFSPACRMEYERDVTSVRAALGEETFNTLHAEGRAMRLEQAIELALTQA